MKKDDDEYGDPLPTPLTDMTISGVCLVVTVLFIILIFVALISLSTGGN